MEMEQSGCAGSPAYCNGKWARLPPNVGEKVTQIAPQGNTCVQNCIKALWRIQVAVPDMGKSVPPGPPQTHRIREAIRSTRNRPRKGTSSPVGVRSHHANSL